MQTVSEKLKEMQKVLQPSPLSPTDLLLKKHFWFSMLKIVVLVYIFVETMIRFSQDF